ncbi:MULTISPECIES: mycothiol transferase [Streptomyces]|uniref:mycothiol transferase n=1 Tax=Streptomyces TaxID=1883 RepID=UPI0035A0D666
MGPAGTRGRPVRRHGRRTRLDAGIAGTACPARVVAGRFQTPDQAPSLGRILFHLLQEYARHLGHLDIARELIDGETGE